MDMDILKGIGKVLGTTALGAAGVASTVLRGMASAVGSDELAVAQNAVAPQFGDDVVVACHRIVFSKRINTIRK